MSFQRACLAVCIYLLAAVSAGAQVAGRLSGTVSDPSGAVVPGASVNVLASGGKEPLLTGRTDETGAFSFVTVRPGVYDVAVEATGFGRVVLRQVTVSPVQETTLPSVRLELLATATTIEVTTEIQAVHLSNAEVSTTITSEQVQNLPVLGRQVNTLFLTQAGVSAANATTNVNGLRASFSAVTLDGVTIQEFFSRTNSLDYAPMRTTIDQVAEITAATANPNVSLGGGASQFVLTTKSGTNNFHGSVYWYNRNSALAANDWFNNQSGTSRSQLNLNQPGASLGGRILKDKLFFYGNYELYRNKQQSTRLRQVLTDTAKAGVFQYRDAGGTLLTANLPALRSFTIDPTMKSLMGQLPAPNAGGTGDGLNTSGYRFNSRSNEFRDQFVFKTDYYLNSRHSITGTYNSIDNPIDRPELGLYYTTTPTVSNTIRNQLVSVAWRWSVTPKLTNELRGGFLRTDTSFLNSVDYPKYLLGGLLFHSPVNNWLEQGRKVNTYTFQDNATWSKGRHDFSFGAQGQIATVAPFNDAGILPTYTLGISANNTTGLVASDLPGIRTSDLPTANNLYANLAGIIQTAAQTFNVTSATSGFVPGATNLRELRQSVWSAYGHDKWRVRPNLVVNLGLRYEYWTAFDEKNGLYLAPRLTGDVRSSVLDPNAILDFIGGPSGRPLYNADKANFAPNVGFAWDPFKKGTTSIRGGYSISFVNDNMLTTFRGVVGQSSGLSFANTQSNLVASLAAPPTVSAPAYKVPRTLADNFAITSTSFTGIPDPNVRTPHVHQWNFGVEHSFKGTVVSARYIGNRGSDLLRSLDYNQVLYNANGFLADFQRAQNNARLAQAVGQGFNGSYNPAISGSQPLTVFPLLQGGGNLTSATIQQFLQRGEIGELANQYMINKTNGSVNFWPNRNVQGARVVTNHGFSNYHAMQLEAIKRTRSGLQAQFSYTLAKGLANAAGDSATNNEALLDNDNPGLEYSRTPFDLRHVLKANYYYELPFGRGKKWSGGRAMNAVLGGWALSGIWTYTSGAPYTILSGYGTLNRQGNATEHLSDTGNTASLLGNVANLNALTSGLWKTGNAVYFVNPSIINPADGRGAAAPGSPTFAGQIFTNPAAGTVGALQRRMFSGPWQWSFDTSVKKSVRVREGMTLDLHFSLFNVFNHPAFYLNPSDGGDFGVAGPYTVNNSAFGQFTAMSGTPRIIQIGAYFRF